MFGVRGNLCVADERWLGELRDSTAEGKTENSKECVCNLTR